MGANVLRIAVSVGTPLALAGLIVGVLYLVYRLILKGKLSKVLPEHTFLLLNRIALYVFILALVATVLGIGAFFFGGKYNTSTVDLQKKLRLEQEARYHLGQGFYSSALTEANELVKIDGQNTEGYDLRGSAHFKLGEYASALQDFRTSLDTDPHSLVTLFDEGAALIALGDYMNAKPIFEQLRGADPSDMDVRYNLALVDLLLGNYQAAKEGYTIVRNARPNRMASATLGLGISEMLGGIAPGERAVSQGIDHLREAVSLQPRLRGVLLGTLHADSEENYEPYLALLQRLEKVNGYQRFLVQLRKAT